MSAGHGHRLCGEFRGGLGHGDGEQHQDLYAEGDLYAYEVGGDFAAESFPPRRGGGLGPRRSGPRAGHVERAALPIETMLERLAAVAAGVPEIAEYRPAIERFT